MEGEIVEFSHFAGKNPSSQVSIGLGRSKKCPSCKSRSKAFSYYSFQLILLPFPPAVINLSVTELNFFQFASAKNSSMPIPKIDYTADFILVQCRIQPQSPGHEIARS